MMFSIFPPAVSTVAFRFLNTLMELVGKLVAYHGPLLVHRDLPSDDDQTIKVLRSTLKAWE